MSKKGVLIMLPRKTVQDVWSAAHRFGQQEVRLPAVTFALPAQQVKQMTAKIMR